MTLFLHIGMGKTGSTTIQHFLMRHRAALKEHGYLFPETFGRHNHESLSVFASGFGPGFARHKRPDLQTDIAFREWGNSLVEGFAKEIRAAKPKHIVCSNEHMFEIIRGERRFKRLQRLLGPAGTDDIKIVVYLRRPDSFVASYYAEMVRMGYGGTVEQLLENPRSTILLNYEEAVGGWGDAFGDENVHIRIFEPNRLVDGDVLADFGSILGFDLLSLAVDDPPERQRDSLDAYRTNFLRLFNAEITKRLRERKGAYGLNDFKTVKVRGRLVRALNKGEPRGRFKLQRETARALVEKHRASNERLFARFGVQGFDGSDPPETPPLEDHVDLELFFELFAEVWLNEAGGEQPAA